LSRISAHIGDAIPFEHKTAIEDVACYLVRSPLSLKKLELSITRILTHLGLSPPPHEGLVGPLFADDLRVRYKLEVLQAERPDQQWGYAAILVPKERSALVVVSAVASYYVDESGTIRKASGRAAGQQDPVVADALVDRVSPPPR
jgi:hypothetical protein